MSVIFGMLALDGEKIPARAPEKMIHACTMWPHDRVAATSGDNWFLGCKQQYNTPQAALADQPVSSDDDRYRLVFDGRIDNREEIAASCRLTLSEKTTDEELIIGAYTKFGDELGQHLIGDFAIAIVDSFENNLYLIRDHMGVRPLFIAQSKKGIAFASTKAALLELQWVDQTPNEYWIADLLASCKVDVETTIYQGIETLPPAHWMKGSTEATTKKRYWQLELKPEKQSNSSPAESAKYIQSFKALLDQAVRCRLRCYTPVASEMSGGLDSTTVTATASNISLERNEKMSAFSHVMPESNIGQVFPYHDESSQMAAICKMHPNIVHHPIYGENRGVLTQLKRNIQIHSGPSRSDLTLMGEELLSTLQDKGIRALLSGFGGDQMVTSHGHGWETDYIKRRDWKGLWREICCLDIDILRKILRYLKTRFPVIAKIRYSFEEAKWSMESILKIMSPALAESADYPARAIANPTRKRVGSVREQEHNVIHSPHVVYRLEDSAVGAGTYGVDYRYPLLDIRLMQYYLNMPSDQKIRSGIQRRVIREATIGLLPENIRMRHDKSRSTIPTVLPRFLRDRDLLKNALTELKQSTRLDDYVATENLAECLDKLAPDKAPNQTISLSFAINSFKLGLWLKRE